MKATEVACEDAGSQKQQAIDLNCIHEIPTHSAFFSLQNHVSGKEFELRIAAELSTEFGTLIRPAATLGSKLKAERCLSK